ncbi:MAG: AMP-binding protein [Spirochaetaceae bacterium]|nr:AMP-binding protein [Spirochaetaceae bacterium]
MATTLPLMFMEKAQAQPTVAAQYAKDASGEFAPISYAELLADIAAFAQGLAKLEVQRGDRIGLISDNRREWLVTDLAILGLGAADVPRGCDATEDEIRYILSWSECKLAILENERQLEKLLTQRERMPLLTRVLLFDAPSAQKKAAAEKAGLAVSTFAEVDAAGRLPGAPAFYAAEAAKGKPDDLATLIYTSGTTGEPKGVMLSHANFLHQTDYIPSIVHLKSGDIFLSVLPIWHSFERISQYMILAAGASVAYSKPIGSVMLADFQAVRPQWMSSVPRIWESVMEGIYRNIRQHGGAKKVLFTFFVGVGETRAYFRDHILGRVAEFHQRSRLLELASSIIPFLLLSPLYALGNLLVFKKVKQKLGGRFIAGISGGGALPPAVDRFFGALGVLILEGYGLTETAPVLAVRPQDHPVGGTVGPALRGTELKIVDETGKPLPFGHKGLIMARGPSVMKGYYKRPELTAKVLSADGWLDTGDLGMLTRNGELKITGRAKDTIVLRGGENVEPAPIEQKLAESPYIRTAVVLGQDERFLAALIVPKEEAVSAWAEENNIPIVDYETLLKQPEVLELIDGEVSDLISPRHGFKSFERIFRFTLLPKAFEVGRELSAKQEIKRHVIAEIYAKEEKQLFAN